jgi:hypothetical protein
MNFNFPFVLTDSSFSSRFGFQHVFLETATWERGMIYRYTLLSTASDWNCLLTAFIRHYQDCCARTRSFRVEHLERDTVLRVNFQILDSMALETKNEKDISVIYNNNR